MSTVVCILLSCSKSKQTSIHRYFRYWIQSEFLYHILPKGESEGGRRSRHLKRRRKKKGDRRKKTQNPTKKIPTLSLYSCLHETENTLSF